MIQNSGVYVTSGHQGTMVDFYGILNDILEVRYMGWRRVQLFSCYQFDVYDTTQRIHIGEHVTSANMSRTWYRDEPFVLAYQASQVFYLEDTKLSASWHVVQKITYKNVYEIPQLQTSFDGDEVSEPNVYKEEQCYDIYKNVNIDRNDHQTLSLTPFLLLYYFWGCNDSLDDQHDENGILEES